MNKTISYDVMLFLYVYGIVCFHCAKFIEQIRLNSTKKIPKLWEIEKQSLFNNEWKLHNIK